MSSPSALTEHIIIIDDSNRVRSLLVSTIMSSCAATNKSAYLIQSSTFGVFTHSMGAVQAQVSVPDVIIGVADCARNALELLDPMLVRRATILCDIETPADMQVGLFGLLDHLAKTRIPVNIIFMSSEPQNILCVEGLVTRRKAYFVEKGSQPWVELPKVIVDNLDNMTYTIITHGDYDEPFLETVQLPKPPAEQRVWDIPPIPDDNYIAPAEDHPRPNILRRLRNLLQSFRMRVATE